MKKENLNILLASMGLVGILFFGVASMPLLLGMATAGFSPQLAGEILNPPMEGVFVFLGIGILLGITGGEAFSQFSFED